MRVHHLLDRTCPDPEVEHAHAGDVAGVEQRLEGGDGGRARCRVRAQPVDDPLHLVAALGSVVEQPARVAPGVPKGFDTAVVGEVGVHPGEPLRVGEPRDEGVLRVGVRDRQGRLLDLQDRHAVVFARLAVRQDLPRHVQPRLADGVGVDGDVSHTLALSLMMSRSAGSSSGNANS